MLIPVPRPAAPRPLRAAWRALAVWLALFLCLPGTASASSNGFFYHDYPTHTHPRLTPPDRIKARGALLIDARTGDVLYARNPNERLLPASTTKLMTALIVYQKIGMTGNVTIVQDDTRVVPSSVPLIPGETISVNTLFHALLIKSANDAARALGRYVAGSTPAFVLMMNQRAQEMHLYNTHFYNPNGLPAPRGTHYISCANLMKIFQAVLAYPELRVILSTKEYPITTRAGTQMLRSHNHLLGVYPGMGPAKTGWTVASRHTYAASVTRHGRELLLTLMDTPNKWIDAQILFNWGFAQPPSAGETELQPSAPPIPAENAYSHSAP